MTKYLLPLALVCSLTWTACENKKEKVTSHEGSLSPAEALKSFELEPGFKIELLASEPLVASPVDMEIDEDGRMYVVEMPGYPLDKSGTGKIKLLSDTDGDGVMDKSVVFAEDLTLPNGIMRWKKGVIVTDAPDVLYLEDTDGDGKSDVRKKLLTGFSLSNPHVNVNNPIYGLDNWVYLSHLGAIGTRKYGTEFGDTGSEVHFADQAGGPQLPKNASSNNVRFRPDSRELELASSRSQFGHTFDRWGSHLLTHNQNHIYHEVIAARYLARNPSLVVSNATQPISDHGDATEVFQITTNPDRQLFTPVGVTTSSSGITAYLGGLFPAPYDGNVTFVAESVSNLVHVDVLKEKGATFVAGRQHPGKEFLASKDSWSRPVNMYVGPDGALYVLDYYRRIIEHPEWMSDEAVEAGGLYDGHDMGRIYRITPTGTGKPDWTKGVSLGKSSPKALVAHLADKNIWWRQNAQRLLVDRQDVSIVPDLEQMVSSSTVPEGRLHALWTLQGLNKLSAPLIAAALADREAGVRENAVRLAELHLKTAPELEKALVGLEKDPSDKVRFQLLCTLGFVASGEAAAVRQRLLFRDIQDEWVQIAAISADSSQTVPLLKEVLARYDAAQPAYGSLVRRLTAMVAAGRDLGEVHQLVRMALSGKGKQREAAVLEGLAQGVKRRKDATNILASELPSLVDAALTHPVSEVRKAALDVLKSGKPMPKALLTASLQRAEKVIGNTSLAAADRSLAVSLFGLDENLPAHIDFLKKLIQPKEEPEVQMAAIRMLDKVPGKETGAFVLSKWESLTPDVRDAALDLFITDKERVPLLLDAIETGKVQSSGLGYLRGVRLMSHSDDALRDRARALLTGGEDKEKAIKEYQKSLELTGDPNKGMQVFVQHCSICHQVRGEMGVVFGPDLGTVHNWLPKDLLANILDPALAMAPGYDYWGITLNTGETIQGTIASETSSAIQLRQAPGVERTVNRQDIQSIQTLKMSPMPSFAGQIEQQAMADLIAFLRNSRQQNK
ncbi:c-type cytochrome [Ravibacter arvi]|uniref:C-type cytochrome n=1 Tax=Ravibacter arvi TaxID=2051041 RepID=A0ABP8M7E4_9BACT